jgi:hypothetical protein
MAVSYKNWQTAHKIDHYYLLQIIKYRQKKILLQWYCTEHSNICDEIFRFLYICLQKKLRLWEGLQKMVFLHRTIKFTGHDISRRNNNKAISIKGIVSWDFDIIFMILSYSFDVKLLPLDILFFSILMFSY